jgi:hypothetical protein
MGESQLEEDTMTKRQLNVRVSEITRRQIDDLTARTNATAGEIVMMSVDRMAREEKEEDAMYFETLYAVNMQEFTIPSGTVVEFLDWLPADAVEVRLPGGRVVRLHASAVGSDPVALDGAKYAAWQMDGRFATN